VVVRVVGLDEIGFDTETRNGVVLASLKPMKEKLLREIFQNDDDLDEDDKCWWLLEKGVI
jgi:hypothetical protein